MQFAADLQDCKAPGPSGTRPWDAYSSTPFGQDPFAFLESHPNNFRAPITQPAMSFNLGTGPPQCRTAMGFAQTVEGEINRLAGQDCLSDTFSEQAGSLLGCGSSSNSLFLPSEGSGGDSDASLPWLTNTLMESVYGDTGLGEEETDRDGLAGGSYGEFTEPIVTLPKQEDERYSQGMGMEKNFWGQVGGQFVSDPPSPRSDSDGVQTLYIDSRVPDIYLPSHPSSINVPNIQRVPLPGFSVPTHTNPMPLPSTIKSEPKAMPYPGLLFPREGSLGSLPGQRLGVFGAVKVEGAGMLPQSFPRMCTSFGPVGGDSDVMDRCSALLNAGINPIVRQTGTTPLADSTVRQECLARYREKKARRLYSKTIRYHKRKVNADARPRIKGRFVKASELEQYRKADDAVLDDIMTLEDCLFD